MNNSPVSKLLAALIVAGGLLVSTGASSYVYISSRCPNGAHWSAANQPLNYYINENGSADLSMSALETQVQASFAAWGEPCCSTYSATYQGTTTRTARQNGGDVVLSWEEQNWPAQLGSVRQTIAVTLSAVDRSCTIASAPILFNGVGFDFCTSGNRCADIRSIATHEIGHNLGLGHSQKREATMYYAYSGGTDSQTLSQDDINGVCSLYPGSCSCSSDSDCGNGRICDDGQCQEAPCQSDSECPGGQECNASSGDCEIPTCSSDTDCDDDYICGSDGRCVSACPVCRTCQSRNDCGPNGFCAQLGGANKCITSCAGGAICPGDSRCFQVPTPAISGRCSSQADCSSGESCLQTNGDTKLCATVCDQNSDCGDQQICGDSGVCSDVNNLCLNASARSAGLCPSSYTCKGGGSTDPCADVTCADGEACEGGLCVDNTPTDPGGSDTDDVGVADAGDGSSDAGGDASTDPTGGSDAGADTAPTVSFTNNNSDDSDSNCSVDPGQPSVPTSEGGWIMLAILGAGWLWRRQRPGS